jgi:hypothetical protein
MRPSSTFRHPATIVCIALLSMAIPKLCRAQDMPTESKGEEISAFAGGLSVAPDYDTPRDTGIVAGATFTRFFEALPFAPAFEARATDVHGPTVDERTVSFGLQATRRFHRFYPYANFLIGIGSIVYAVNPVPGEHEDRGREFSLGGGLDIDIVHNIRARIDFQQQFWNLGTNPTLAPRAPNNVYTLSPTAIMIGINYVIPFRPHLGFRGR